MEKIIRDMIDVTGYWDKNFAMKHHVHSQKVSDWIVNFLQNEKHQIIYDFGCGMGTYLKDLYDNGFHNLKGFETDPPKWYEEFEIIKVNLINPIVLEEKGVVISLEVGEHIPSTYQDTYLNTLCDATDKYLIISWACRGQGGYGHVNELNNDEIIPIIEQKGFKFLKDASEDFRKVPEPNYWYFKNTLMIFEKI